MESCHSVQYISPCHLPAHSTLGHLIKIVSWLIYELIGNWYTCTRLSLELSVFFIFRWLKLCVCVRLTFCVPILTPFDSKYFLASTIEGFLNVCSNFSGTYFHDNASDTC